MVLHDAAGWELDRVRRRERFERLVADDDREDDVALTADGCPAAPQAPSDVPG